MEQMPSPDDVLLYHAVAPGNDDRRSGLGKCLGHFQTQPAIAADHERRLSGEAELIEDWRWHTLT